jgi:hypothetical protein
MIPTTVEEKNLSGHFIEDRAGESRFQNPPVSTGIGILSELHDFV